MPVNFRTRLGRFVLPLCLILTAVVACAFYSHATQFVPPENGVTTSSIIDQNSEYEAWMQAKAERVLKAFGESSPTAVVSVELKMDKSETEVFAPDPKLKVVESVQTTEELMEKEEDRDDLIASLDSRKMIDGFRPKYRNNKNAKNFLVGQTKTKTVRTHPKLGKVSCVVFVSDKNKERRQDIETAVAVALGLEFGRGDAVLATVR